MTYFQKTFPGRARVNFAQNKGHEKKHKKIHEKGTNIAFLTEEGHEQATEKPRKSNK